MIVVTGASGQLGRMVIEELQKRMPSSEIVAAVRTVQKVEDLKASGVVVHEMDYTRPETIASAIKGADKVLLISSSNVGNRVGEHQNVIEACKNEGVSLLAYTSMLHADSSPLMLSQEHKESEALLKASNVPYVLLRNGWYSENYTMNIMAALEHGAVLGSAKTGRYALASRRDYAKAAAAVLTKEHQSGKVYELAGDRGYTLEEYAAAISKVSGKSVVYNDMPQEAYANVLVQIGLPEGFAMALADADVGASQGALYDDSKTLSTLIGEPTTAIEVSIRAALG